MSICNSDKLQSEFLIIIIIYNSNKSFELTGISNYWKYKLINYKVFFTCEHTSKHNWVFDDAPNMCVYVLVTHNRELLCSFAPCIAKICVSTGPTCHRSRDTYHVMPTRGVLRRRDYTLKEVLVLKEVQFQISYTSFVPRDEDSSLNLELWRVKARSFSTRKLRRYNL